MARNTKGNGDKLATKKPKFIAGPLEIALKTHELQQKQAVRKASEPFTESDTEQKPVEVFHYANPKHPYGTCWKCESPRRHAGGSPGGSESYFCPECNEWLVIRDNPKDTKRLRTYQ